MNLTVNLVSLVLASTTGWVLLVFGALPVSVLRTHPREPLLAAAAWAVVAATAPPQVFHWYLIFAVFSLVAFTKLHRPAGKIWLAVVAALGLTLGIVFPIESTPALLQREEPYNLGTLYLGGATTALAYAISVTSVRQPAGTWRPQALARGLLISSMLWTALLAARPYLSRHFAIVRPLETWLPLPTFNALIVTLFGIAFVGLLLSVTLLRAVRQPRPNPAGVLAAIAALLALVESFLAQFFYCGGRGF